ncbi:MAG TPA: hypothetical protein DIC42_00285 [Holosporales bacterium]|nr:hypothetical protein [Holosporales bacterium]
MYHLLFIIILFMGGCNPFSDYAPSSEKTINRFWAKSEQQGVPKLYCYQTLGEHKCVDKPIPNKEHLLVGQHVLTTEPQKKEFWEVINLHPILGIDDETMRQELGYPAKGVVPAPKTAR